MTDPTPPTPTPPAPAPAPAATFTQEQLNAIAAREKDSGKKSGRTERDAELASLLGVTVDDLPGHLESLKTEADSRKSEAQRATEAATTAKAAADKAIADAALERHAMRVERALLRAGVPADDGDLLSDAVTLVRVDPAADDAALTAAIDAVKGRHPTMFGAAKPAPRFGSPPDVRPPSGRPGPPTDGRDPQVERQLARRGIGVKAS